MKTDLEKNIELATQALQAQQFDKAQSLFRNVLQEAEAKHDELVAATCLDNLGEILFQQNRFLEAENFYKRALEIRDKLLSNTHEDIVTSLNNLSAAYFFQSKYEQAKPLCKQLLGIYEIVLGKDHPEAATCLINLGLIALAEKNLPEAEKYFSNAQNIRLSTYGPKHILVGNSLGHLGNVYLEQKQLKLAYDALKESLNILEKHLDLSHPDLEKAIGKLIECVEQMGEYEELKELYPRLINLKEIHLGPAHPEVAFYLEKLAELNLRQKQYDAATKLLQRLLSMKRRSAGETNPQVADLLARLAYIQQMLHQNAQAESTLIEAIHIYEKNNRSGSGHTGQYGKQFFLALRDLATLYENEKRFAKSEKEWRRLQQLIEPQGNERFELLLETYEHLANTLIEQKQMNEAQALLQKALHLLDEASTKGSMPVVSPSTGAQSNKTRRAHILVKLAHVLKAAGQFSEAESHYKNALDMLIKALGSNHPDLAPALEGYADLLTRTYREPEAEHMLACARRLTSQ